MVEMFSSMLISFGLVLLLFVVFFIVVGLGHFLIEGVRVILSLFRK